MGRWHFRRQSKSISARLAKLGELMLFKLFALMVAFFIVPATWVAALDNESLDSSYQGVEFRRWSPIVSNLDETIHLYVDILGFELGSVTVDPKTSYVFEVFAIDRDVTTRHATFDAGDEKRVLSVVEVPGAKVRTDNLPRMSAVLLNARGHFDEIVRRLIEEGYQTLTPHKLGKNGIEIGFIDRDGHLYALYEFPYKGSDHKL